MCWAQSLMLPHSVVLKAHEVPFPRRQPSRRRTRTECLLDSGPRTPSTTPSAPPPREEALTVVGSEKSQGQTQHPKFQMPARVPTLSQRRDAPH